MSSEVYTLTFFDIENSLGGYNVFVREVGTEDIGNLVEEVRYPIDEEPDAITLAGMIEESVRKARSSLPEN